MSQPNFQPGADGDEQDQEGIPQDGEGSPEQQMEEVVEGREASRDENGLQID